MDSLVLIIIAVALIEAAIKKVDIFKEFLDGVKEGSKLLITLFLVNKDVPRSRFRHKLDKIIVS